MKNGPGTALAERILNLALRLMPARRRDWAEAMRSEFDAAAADGRALRFAMGCLTTALPEFARTRRGLALLGRVTVGACLVGVGAFGIALSFGVYGVYEGLPAQAVGIVCALYLLGGAMALLSTRALRLFAVSGLSAAAAAWLFAMTTPFPALGEASSFVAALCIEFTLIMAALLFVAVYLSLLYSSAHERPAGA